MGTSNQTIMVYCEFEEYKTEEIKQMVDQSAFKLLVDVGLFLF